MPHCSRPRAACARPGRAARDRWRARARALYSDTLRGVVEQGGRAVSGQAADGDGSAASDGGQEHSGGAGYRALPGNGQALRQRIVVLVGAQGEREPLGACLAELGHAVVGAEDGLQALGVMQSVGADLMVLDLTAPASFSALEKRRTTRALREIPCLVLAPADATDHVGRAVALGADDFLMKPVVPVLLQTKVEGFLEARRLREQEHAIRSEERRVGKE